MKKYSIHNKYNKIYEKYYKIYIKIYIPIKEFWCLNF